LSGPGLLSGLGRRQRTSLLALIVADSIPLIGVIAFGWDLLGVMLLYWTENAIVGFYNLLKMICIDPAGAIPLGAFFCIHYGIFMLVHLMFVFQLFGSDPWAFPGVDDVAAALAPMEAAIAASFVSHGISFFANFLRGREYEGRSLNDQLVAPYPRLMLMQVTVIAGAWCVDLLGTPVVALALLVVLKTAADARAHLRERRKAAPAAA